MPDTDLLTVFLMGLLGSVHCVGMCGGIAGLLGSQANSPGQESIKNSIRFSLLYNLGRITSYIIAGILVAGLGLLTAHAGQSAGIPNISKMIIGLLTLFFGFYLMGWTVFLLPLEKMGGLIWRYIEPVARKFLPVQTPVQAFVLGSMWGWLPCGMVYVALSWSVVTAAPVQGGLMMAMFGLGTLPAMLMMSITGSQVRKALAKPLPRTVIGILVVVYGLYLMTEFVMGTGSHSHH